MAKMKIYFVCLFVLFAFSAINAEPQPHMKAAQKHLEDAKSELQKASADKGGHRAKAIQLVNDAIEEVKKGIAADNKK